jgi:hypothetical protein
MRCKMFFVSSDLTPWVLTTKRISALIFEVITDSNCDLIGSSHWFNLSRKDLANSEQASVDIFVTWFFLKPLSDVYFATYSTNHSVARSPKSKAILTALPKRGFSRVCRINTCTWDVPPIALR